MGRMALALTVVRASLARYGRLRTCGTLYGFCMQGHRGAAESKIYIVGISMLMVVLEYV